MEAIATQSRLNNDTEGIVSRRNIKAVYEIIYSPA